MFFLVPVEVISSRDFLLYFLFEFEDVLFGEVFGDGLIFFFENSNIFLVIKSKLRIKKIENDRHKLSIKNLKRFSLYNLFMF